MVPFSITNSAEPRAFTLFGISLAIFLGFRNNVSYDRFWEGRKLWGSMFNSTRSLARQAQTLTHILLHRTMYFYCFLLPFGFVDSLGWMMPVIVTFIACTFVALEAVADELEDPFGVEPNDLETNALCTMIEHTLR